MMRKAVISIFILAMFVLGNTLYVRGSNFETEEVNFAFSPPHLHNGVNYVTFSDASNSLSSAGYPVMPYESKVMTFPFGTKIKGIDVSIGDVQTIHLDKKIAPAPEAVPLNGAEPTGVQEGEIYQSDSAYPSNWVEWNTGAGLENGRRVVFLTIHAFPARYVPASNELQYVDGVNVKVRYVPPAESMPLKDVYDLLIIAPSEFTDALQPLVDHKNSWGIPTYLATLDEAYSSTGRDNAEKIKYFIKDAVEKWGVKYVMLVGSAGKFPIRLSYTYDGEESNFISDLYYADVYDADGRFSSWDTNNNDLFGEYDYHGKTDEMDLYPDVYVGRLACDSTSEVSSVVDKIIYYESATYGSEWFERAVLCGGDSHDDNGGVLEGEYTKEHADNYLGDFEITKLYVSTDSLDDKSIKQAINDGAGFVDFSGHGNRYSWATHPPGEFDTWIGIDVSDVTLLSNTNEYPVVVLDACSTGNFKYGNCLAWHFVKVGDRGAIATFATTALSWGYLGSSCIAGLSGYMDVHLTRYISERGMAGDALSGSINDYLNYHSDMSATDYKTVEEFELFGDPTLKIGGYEGCSLSKPRPGYLYLFNKEVMPTLLGRTVIIGQIDIDAAAATDITRVEFYVDSDLKYTAESEPYSWLWDERAIGRHTVKIVGYKEGGNTVENSLDVIIFNL